MAMFSDRSPLEDMKRRGFLQKVRSALLARIGQTPGGYTGGPTAGQFGTMSSAPASAQDQTAFNQRNQDRAQFGDRWNTKGGIGRPGIEREKMGLGATLKREEFDKDKRLREMMEAGESARRGVMEAGATGRQGMIEGTRKREQDFRYAPGDAFTPKGVDRSIAETGRYRAETERMYPKVSPEKAPQFIPGSPIERVPDRMFGRNPKTGAYDVAPVPTRTLEFQPGRDRVAQQTLPDYNPTKQDPMQYLKSLPPEIQEYLLEERKKRNAK